MLDAPIPYFSVDWADGNTAQDTNASGLLTKRETLKLVRAYYKFSDLAIRNAFLSWRVPSPAKKHFNGLGRTGQLDARPKDCDKVAGLAHGWVAFRYL